MQRILYSTMTADLTHKGHIEFLKLCKMIVGPNGLVIIGLTTDELAIKQKRKPVMNYEQRRDILMALKYVDAVVAHNGQTKQEAHAQLHFTDLAIGEEYRGSPEYTSMESTCRVHYLPCSLNRITSSSAITAQMGMENARKFRILSNGGPGGMLFMYDDKPESVVLKAIRVSQKEFNGHFGTWSGPMNTANVYGVPVPAPRNWKKLGDPHQHPNLPGVNAYRELAVQAIIKDRPWSTVIDTRLEFEDKKDCPIHTERQDWSHINADKQTPKQIYWILMRYAGQTLHDWIEQNKHDNEFVVLLQRAVDRIRDICEELKAMGLIHFDIHSTNVCIQNKKSSQPKAVGAAPESGLNIYLIDWGWSTHRSFQMDEDERLDLEAKLECSFDWQHFVDSMHFSYHDEPWLEHIKF